MAHRGFVVRLKIYLTIVFFISKISGNCHVFLRYNNANEIDANRDNEKFHIDTNEIAYYTSYAVTSKQAVLYMYDRISLINFYLQR